MIILQGQDFTLIHRKPSNLHNEKFIFQELDHKMNTE